MAIENEANGNGRIRVFQIVENLDNRAVEAWLVRVFRNAVVQYPLVDWTFFCVLPQAGEFDDEVRAAGGHVIHSEHELGEKIPFMTSLRRVMQQQSYDVLHCHHDIMSAAYLLASAGLPFKKRIVHLHNTALSLPTPNRIKTELLRGPMRQVCLKMADRIVGISEEALDSLVGPEGRQVGRDRVVHYAVDTKRFRDAEVDPLAFRNQLGLSANAQVVLFVGRMVEYKNPRFVIDVLNHLARIEPEAVAVFVGAGDQENVVRSAAAEQGLSERVRFLGFRNDVAEIMLAADVLLWPSEEEPKEGLGLGIIEAQAAGLPILMSQSVPLEAIVIPELVEVLPLAAKAQAWANNLQQILHQSHPSRKDCLARVESSSFALQAGVDNLIALYH